MNIAVNAAALVAAPSIATADETDTELLALEERIWELDEKANEHNEEIFRLQEIWMNAKLRLDTLAAAGLSPLGKPEISEFVSAMPECKEHGRLLDIVNPIHEERDQLIKEMWKIPAKTCGGRRAKALVLIGSVMGGRSDWLASDRDADWDIEMARNLLVEFVGGEQGEELREYWQPAA